MKFSDNGGEDACAFAFGQSPKEQQLESAVGIWRPRSYGCLRDAVCQVAGGQIRHGLLHLKEEVGIDDGGPVERIAVLWELPVRFHGQIVNHGNARDALWNIAEKFIGLSPNIGDDGGGLEASDFLINGNEAVFE